MSGETVDGLDIWVFDLNSGQALQVTQTPVQESLPDGWDQGRTIVFNRGSNGGSEHVLRKPAQTVGQEEILAASLALRPWRPLREGFARSHSAPAW